MASLASWLIRHCGIGDETVKSDRSVVVLRHFGLGHIIGFQAAVSDTSGEKHPESSYQLIVRPRCLRRIVRPNRRNKWHRPYTELGVECQMLVAPYPF